MHGDLRPARQPAAQGIVGEPGQLRVGDGRRARGARADIKQRELTEHLTRAVHAEQVLPAVVGGPGELDLALEDDVELVPGVALGEQPLAAVELHVDHVRPQRAGVILAQGLEQRRLAERVVLLSHGRPF